MKMHIVPAYDRAEDIRALFTEYTAMLVEAEPAFAGYLTLQNYDREVADLTYKYGPPAGRLYLAERFGEVAGCIALRPLDGERCELKRLYVRPAFRGQGIAGALVDKILSDARAIGYRQILLDTLPALTTAIDMYRRRGFADVPPYNNSPLADTIFMGLELAEPAKKR